MPSLLRVIILIFVLSFAVSSPLPYTIEGLEYGVSENDIKDIEQKRASGVDEVSFFYLLSFCSYEPASFLASRASAQRTLPRYDAVM